MDKDIWGLLGVVLIVLGGFYIFSTSRKRNKEWESSLKEQQKISLPLRLQAAERMILFLERIRPQNLLTRINTEGLNNFELQSRILGQIKTEFDYNATQQLYLNKATWDKISLAANNTSATLVHTLSKDALQMKPKDAVVFLLQNEDPNVQRFINEAIDAIKAEVQKNF